MDKDMVALMTVSWACQESCGICQGTDGKFYFFWQQVERDRLQEFLDKGQLFVCDVARHIDSLAKRHNKHSDLIPSREHEQFMQEWLPHVANPEFASLLRECKYKGHKMERPPTHGELMSIATLIDRFEKGLISDGMGYYAIGDMMSKKSVYPSDVRAGQIDRTFTHVVWLNS